MMKSNRGGSFLNPKLTILNPQPSNAHIAKNILSDLPEWFGIPEALDEYVEHAQNHQMIVAEMNSEIVGFLSFYKLDEQSVEIDSMGVLKTFHRRGVGTKLIELLENFCKENHVEMIEVKTLDESHPDKNYAKTRKFYAKCGFEKVRVTDEWGEENPCLVLHKNISK
jgi:N-acetylglutamate synthase-like GNAT family acetyltransferase